MATSETIDVVKMLQEMKRARFWGSIQFDLQDGEVVLMRRTETTKIYSSKENNREHNSGR